MNLTIEEKSHVNTQRPRPGWDLVATSPPRAGATDGDPNPRNWQEPTTGDCSVPPGDNSDELRDCESWILKWSLLRAPPAHLGADLQMCPISSDTRPSAQARPDSSTSIAQHFYCLSILICFTQDVRSIFFLSSAKNTGLQFEGCG